MLTEPQETNVPTPGGPVKSNIMQPDDRSQMNPSMPVNPKDIKTNNPEQKPDNNQTKTGDDMNAYEKEQIEILRTMSMREEEERKKIQEEEERILAQVMEMSSKEHDEEVKQNAQKADKAKADEIKKKEDKIKAKERRLKEKEAKLKAEEERIKKEKEEFERKRLKELEEKTKNPVDIRPSPVPETVSTKAPEAFVAPAPVKKVKKKKKVIEPKVDPNKPGEATYDLPPVSNQRKAGGMMAADYDILREASNDIFGKNKNKNTYDPYADDVSFDPWNKKPKEEGKSMSEMMKEKLSKMNQKEDKKEGEEGKESAEERKARLIAQRNKIVQQKKEAMEKELKEARDGKSENKYSNNLFNELMSLDKKVSQKEAKKKKVVKVEEKPEVKPNEDDEAQPMAQKKPKKDMHSLFDDSDDDDKAKEEAERKERMRKVMREMASEGAS